MHTNYKFSKSFLLIQFFLSLLCVSRSWATTDTLQTKLLNKSHLLIESNDIPSQKICQEIDSVNQIKYLSDSAFVSFLVRDIGGYFRKQGQQSNAIEIFLEAVHHLEKKGSNPKILLKLYLPLGAAFEEVGLWSSAMEYYHKALRIAEDNDMQADIARIYNNIGATYYPTDLEKSKEYMLKSMKLNTDLGDRNELFLNYNNLAAIYVRQDDYNTALDYALQALQMVTKEKNSDMYHSMQCNIGSLYLQKGDFYLAISYIGKAEEFFEKEHNYSELAGIYVLLMEAWEQSDMPNRAKEYAKKIENTLLPQISNSEVESRLRASLSKFYERNNNHYKAYLHLKKASALKDSLYTANDYRKVNNLEHIYDNEQKLRENARIINDMQISKLKTDKLVATIVIVLITLVAIVIFLTIRSQMQQKLLKTNAQLSEQQTILQEKEKELQQIKEQELNNTIDRKNRELSTYALSYTKDSEFLLRIGEELKELLLEINPRNTAQKEKLRKIMTQLKQHYSNDNWQEFKYYFEQVHPSFYKRLDEISPGITQRQKRLCAMLYIGLSTKEISTITYREIRSIDSARNRLRKKLDIPADESIQDFLSRKMTE